MSDSCSRRSFLRLGAAGAAALSVESRVFGQEAPASPDFDPYLTPQEKFRDVSRGNPLPHKLPPEKLIEVGLSRESWKLEVLADPEHPAVLRNPLTKAKGTALDWDGLMKLAAKRTVSFLKVMTCNNIGRPLGMGLWEGVPLRDVVWLSAPQEDLRGLPPVLLCFKLNGKFLTPERGGPVRIVVPETYGFKSVKWLTHLVLTNLPHANDTYADGNNDLDSPLKTYARTISLPKEAKAGEAISVTGLAQVGISGLAKVQVWTAPAGEAWPADDPYFTNAPWKEAEILPAPASWGGDFPEGRLPESTFGLDARTGRPQRWPMPLTKAHWRARLPGLPAGKYSFRCRTIDENGAAQPMPRPFDKSGRAAIEEKPFVVA